MWQRSSASWETPSALGSPASCSGTASGTEASVTAGNRLAYEEQGAGYPAVFIHGLTFSRATWDLLLDRLADRFRCLAVDLPGHGGSASLPRSMEEVMHQVHDLVTGLGIERPVIVGHSLGAMMATFYAATFPVAGVANVDQPLDVEPFLRMVRQVEPALRGPSFAATFEPIRQSIGVELLPEPLRSRTLERSTRPDSRRASGSAPAT